MSTFHHEFRLPDVVETDVLQLVVERAEDPRLSEFWTDLLKNRPGTAGYIQTMCREKAGDSNELYEKLFAASLEIALTLGEAAVRSGSHHHNLANFGANDGDESVPLQAEPHVDQ